MSLVLVAGPAADICTQGLRIELRHFEELRKTVFEKLGVDFREPQPAELKLESVALLMRLSWDIAGLGPYLPARLPSAIDIARHIYRKALSGFEDWPISDDAAPMLMKLLEFWCRDMVWNARETLGAPALLPLTDDEDLLIESCVELLMNSYGLAERTNTE